MTKYLVLKSYTAREQEAEARYASDGDQWKAVAEIEAASAESAIRKHVQADGSADGTVPLAGGTFVAVPAKSFRPITVAVEQVTKVTVS